MSLQVIIHEAKGLSNLTGRIKVRATIVESSGSGYSVRDQDVISLESRSVDEYTNVKFDDADFNL
jgi:hypothetical protein